jgi:hypothetical protein
VTEGFHADCSFLEENSETLLQRTYDTYHKTPFKLAIQ